MIPDGALLALYHKSNPLFYIFFAISVACLTSASTTSNNTQSYKLLTRQGLETSYPEEGGQMVMTCTSDDPTEEVYVRNGDDVIVTAKNKSIVHLPWNLSAESIGSSFQCFPKPTIGRGSFAIQHIFCDPFPLIPPVQDCKESQVCMLDESNTHACANVDENSCFLTDKYLMDKYFNTSFPTYRTACVDSEGSLNMNKETSFGLCHAKFVKQGSSLIGLAANFMQCIAFSSLTLNSKEVQEGGVLIESQHPSVWKIKFKSTEDIEIITCQLSNAAGEEVASFKGYQLDNLKYATGSTEIVYPDKLRFHCEFNNKRYIKVISTYIIAYSNDLSNYQPKLNIRNNADASDALDLDCNVTVPEGLISVLWWQDNSEPKDQDQIKALKNLPISKTKLKYATHASSVTYTCMVAVYAFEYPLSFNLVQLKDIIANGTKLIGPKEFGKNENKTPEEESKTTKSQQPNREHVSEADNGSSNSADDDGTSKKSNSWTTSRAYPIGNTNGVDKGRSSGEGESGTSSKSDSWMIVAIVVIIVLVLVAGAIGAFAYWKRHKKQQLTNPAATASKQVPLNGDASNTSKLVQ